METVKQIAESKAILATSGTASIGGGYAVQTENPVVKEVVRTCAQVTPDFVSWLLPWIPVIGVGCLVIQTCCAIFSRILEKRQYNKVMREERTDKDNLC